MRGESGEDDENCECERKREEGGKNVSLQKIAIFFRFIGVEFRNSGKNEGNPTSQLPPPTS